MRSVLQKLDIANGTSYAASLLFPLSIPLPERYVDTRKSLATSISAIFVFAFGSNLRLKSAVITWAIIVVIAISDIFFSQTVLKISVSAEEEGPNAEVVNEIINRAGWLTTDWKSILPSSSN